MAGLPSVPLDGDGAAVAYAARDCLVSFKLWCTEPWVSLTFECGSQRSGAEISLSERPAGSLGSSHGGARV